LTSRSTADCTRYLRPCAVTVSYFVGNHIPPGLPHGDRRQAAWKLLWLGVVALPLWLDGRLEGAVCEQAAAILWVVIIIAVIPWRQVLAQYVTAPGQPWRRHR
jgi:hypothetical protein